MPDNLHPLVYRFIEDAGNTTQSFGVGRVIGQIYAFLYFSPSPETLDGMRDGLGISKGSASIAVRQLEQWGAVQKVWVKGDRKDYYTAKDAFGKIIKNAILEMVGKKMGDYESLLAEAREQLESGAIEDDADRIAFMQERLEHLQKFQRWSHQLWNSPMLQTLLK